MVPEIVRATLRQLMAPLRVAWRRNWFYRRLLKGRLSDRILYHPNDSLPRRLEEADALLRGRFRFADASVDVTEGSIFDKAAPSLSWCEALHGFAWLPPLSGAGGEAARALATNLVAQWVKRYTRYSEPEWAPEVMARRLINLFAHSRFLMPNSDVLWRSKLFVSLREQSRQLARTAARAPEGFARFEAATALALSGICLDDSPRRQQLGIARLEAEIAAQILPDGGYADRSPESLFHAYRHLMMVLEALGATNHPVPQLLLSAHDRMATMLRFFRHGDEALAVFNGGHECDRRALSALLARDQVRGMPFAYAPHSKFQRLAAAKTYVVMDCGGLPQGVYANTAHAGCLAFELSAGAQRLVVNCGSSSRWDGALRGTPAHSTVTLADTSIAPVLSQGFARRLVGARMLGGPHTVTSQRHETEHGWQVEARHDGYLKLFGIVHERRLTLASDGLTLTGSDVLLPEHRRKQPVPYALRFHIHPDVRVSPSQGGGVLLKLPNGEGWRFRSGVAAAIEESIYIGGENARKCEQLVITGTVGAEPVEIAWVFERIGVS
ncbi:MAG: heparinase II/III family protein [Alphaproteobacteria bacterium]|nr:heparinase II/III family protein [Alphaproteobacteria bacterium]MBU6471971.1 heparinase II/III family protein [Alphaproteobacteria bacterium]MDE2074388.1 heparinase II/III family protein [Alphaproteobacteria bacterium]MDE2351310.1 heparinase II/III family protein [Alphaproteobacteria bacterium]